MRYSGVELSVSQIKEQILRDNQNGMSMREHDKYVEELSMREKGILRHVQIMA